MGARCVTLPAHLGPASTFHCALQKRRNVTEFQIFVTMLLYCGPRLTEALNVAVDDVRIAEAFAFIGRTKNGDPRPVHLPPVVVAAIANHPRGLDRPGETLFRFRKNGNLYSLLAATRARASLPLHVTFHTFRHTWATWMRRYGGLDTKGLVGHRRLVRREVRHPLPARCRQRRSPSGRPHPGIHQARLGEIRRS